ncbi:hypothetical protein MI472_04365 [Staphylococcus epidermidis]|nr:hypothetical protein F6H98_01775 [Staphylococcus epidermidis]MCG7793626.1 hypothetical protein [Staphylococcus epidermidis]NAN10658.1 hypothetical protein [Staphylococcus epidermidis]
MSVVIMNDRLIDVTGGYGTIYKQVMKEPKLSIEAKALYCYYMAYVGDNFIPSATQTCNDLMISYKRFKTLRTQLFERGFL